MSSSMFEAYKDVQGQEPLHWTDKKRPFFGKPWSFTRYCLYETRLAVHSGILTLHQEELRLYRILDVRMRQTLFQRFFGVGTVFLFTTDSTSPQLQLRDVKEPEIVARLISDRAEEERHAKGLTAVECFDSYRI